VQKIRAEDFAADRADGADQEDLKKSNNIVIYLSLSVGSTAKWF